MNRPYILVVDDNAVMTKLVCRYLEMHGFDAVGAADGVACLESVAERVPDVVITDVMMPRMDGIALTAELQRSDATRDIPVIVITALNDHETQQRAFHAGAVDLISKPIDEAVLIAKVRLLAGARDAATQIATLRAAVEAFRRGDTVAAEALLSTLEGRA